MISIKTLVIVILAGVLATLAGTGGGYLYGHSRGVADERARANATTVKELSNIIESHQELVDATNEASKAMREALTTRTAQDTKTTTELKNALAKTAGSRIGCRFDDDVMRNLTAARERAAAAAAGGIRNTVPGTDSSTQ